jgi:Ca-activated chloride channel family protein
MSDESQKLAKSYGFNRLDDYNGDGIEYTGADLIGAQRLWKNNKDSGRDISAVFVADISGSMDGEPLNLLKKSLTNGAQYINNNNRIGLVSYSTDVTIELEIDKFDLNQRAFFQGAVENLSANGSTASYDAIVVALDMLIKEKESNPNAKLMLFLLSDGEANVGASLDDIRGVLEYYQIPVYTISYGEYADTDAMEAVSAINEAASINATVEDVVYKMKSLFNAQM